MRLRAQRDPSEKARRRGEKALSRGRVDVYRTWADETIAGLRAREEYFQAGLTGLLVARALNGREAHGCVPDYCRQARADFEASMSPQAKPADGDPTARGARLKSAHRNIALCYYQEGWAWTQLNAHPQAMNVLFRARNRARAYNLDHEAADAERLWARNLALYGADKHDQKMLEKALGRLRSATDRCIEIDDPRAAAQCSLNVAEVLFLLGRPEDVVDFYPVMRRLCDASGDRHQSYLCELNRQDALGGTASVGAQGDRA